jgi:hypothetical protein
MELDDIKWVFEEGIGDEFMVTHYRFYDPEGSLAGPPVTSQFTLLENNHHGVWVKTEYGKTIFLPYTRIYEVTKIL